MGFYALLPGVLFGICSLYNGNYFIPNPVLLKSSAPPLTLEGITQFFTIVIPAQLSFSAESYSAAAVQRLLILLLLSYLLFYQDIRKNVSYHYLLVLLSFATLVQILSSGRGRFPRYEAYLMGADMVILSTLFFKYGKVKVRSLFREARAMVIFTIIVLAVPIAMRSWDALTLVKSASINIYQQQYQMGKFLGRYYQDTPVAFNDIGAVSLFTAGNNLDLWGLGNIDVAHSRRDRYYSGAFLHSLSEHNNIQVAIVFEKFCPPGLLNNWTKIASWQITSENVICTDDSVSFYSVKPGMSNGLKKNLHDFQASLPKGVVAHYY